MYAGATLTPYRHLVPGGRDSPPFHLLSGYQDDISIHQNLIIRIENTSHGGKVARLTCIIESTSSSTGFRSLVSSFNQSLKILAFAVQKSIEDILLALASLIVNPVLKSKTTTMIERFSVLSQKDLQPPKAIKSTNKIINVFSNFGLFTLKE